MELPPQLKVSLLCLVMLFMTTASLAQIKKIQVLDAQTADPISKVSILFEDENNGTVTDEDGMATLINPKSKHIRFSHLNFEPLSIRFSDLKDAMTVIKLTPKAPNQIEEVSVTFKLDQKLIGRWKLVKSETTILNLNGNIKKYKNYRTSSNIKEYKSNSTFIITSRGKTLIEGNYVALDNQLQEEIIDAWPRSELIGVTNTLFYTTKSRGRKMIVKYKLPNSDAIVEEEWTKVNADYPDYPVRTQRQLE